MDKPWPPSTTMSTYGITYPPAFLDALPVLQHRPHPHAPIRALSAAQFSSIHLNHLLSHAPDNVLFPFLHGLEGPNQAQNLFFASNAAHKSGQHSKDLLVPKHRGLVWVVCPADLHAFIVEEELNDDELDDDSFSDDSSSHLVHSDRSAMDVDHEPHDDQPHMHPCVQRTARPVPTVQTSIPPDSTSAEDWHARRDSSASSFSSTSASPSFLASSSSSPATSIASSVPPDKLPVPISTSSPPPHSPSPAPSPKARSHTGPPVFTSTFYPSELLEEDPEPNFNPPVVPSGISLRNFGIQVPIYATISDIVVYSPKGPTNSTIALAKRFKIAIEKKAAERLARLQKDSTTQDDFEANGLLAYNVFVLSATADEIRETLSHLIIRRVDPSSSTSTTPTTASSIPSFPPNTVDFDKRERDEMRDLTKASEIISVYPSKEAEEQTCLKAKAEGRDMSSTSTHWDPHVGQTFLGNSNDIPRATEPIPPASELFHHEFSDRGDMSNDVEMSTDTESGAKTKDQSYSIDADPFNYATNDPADGLGYDICVESTDIPPFTSAAHLRAAEDHLQMLDTLWAQRCRRNQTTEEGELPPRPPPNANAVIHLAFPCSSLSCGMNRNVIVLVVKFLQRVLQPPSLLHQFPSPVAQQQTSTGQIRMQRSVTSRGWSSAMTPSNGASDPASTPSSTTTTTPNTLPTSTLAQPTRPLKVLIHSFDGYTESSIPALCLLMAVKGLSLPEAYLELQVVKKRSFFVYHADLWVLRAAEAKFRESEGDTDNAGAISVGDGKAENGVRVPNPFKRPAANSVSSSSFAEYQAQSQSQGFSSAPPNPHAHSHTFTHSRSQSFSELDSESESAAAAPQINIGNSNSIHNNHTHGRRPRASTSPWLPSLFKDHQAWFNDPRFDGSFPSRVLPFLYLGNLNHASNVYMLHALGITHVVSVGECALVPPPHINTFSSSSSSSSQHPGTGRLILGKGPGYHGSLWIEEREGRIKVLDIQGVCDDGIDTLEPQLEPICAWIERARLEGGQVLVHCRVGVSRSATVTIAYVMKHLNLPLVDAYLIVRSRRLSVLIQPNMRLLYNLLGWEVKLARDRAGDDEDKLRQELSRALSWPYLAKEVHTLNEKYLR